MSLLRWFFYGTEREPEPKTVVDVLAALNGRTRRIVEDPIWLDESAPLERLQQLWDELMVLNQKTKVAAYDVIDWLDAS